MSRTPAGYHLKGDASYNRSIASLLESTRIPGVVGKKLGFASLFDPKKAKVRDPLLVSTTDGVGTKLELTNLLAKHDTIGIDLVAMCVNDLITTGARPLFFLDYFATGKFNRVRTAEVLKGIVRGCRQAGCALTGGETAIMPGFYGDSKYDLAGFAVGVVERGRVVDGRRIRAGDRLLGLASSGFHSNGYSLLRKIFLKKELTGPIGRELLTPTRIYVKAVLEILKKIEIKGIANITGGGFYDNLPRIFPSGLTALIDSSRWPRAKLFELVRKRAKIPPLNGRRRNEMYRTFNMGIGMVFVLDGRFVKEAQKILSQFKILSWEIGKVVQGKGVSIQ